MTAGLAQTLAGLQALLAAEGYSAQAEGVGVAQRALTDSPAAACSQLASNAFWGGPGAVWEIVFSTEWAPPDAPESLKLRDDASVAAANRQLSELIIALADEFATTCAGRVDQSWIERAAYLRSAHQQIRDSIAP